MTLLREDHSLSKQEDSIAMVVDGLREVYRTEGSIESRDKIISLENELFELRSRKAMVVDSLNLIEQEWVLSSVGEVRSTPQGQTSLLDSSSDGATFIYQGQNVKANLSDIDFKNLLRAEELEAEAQKLSDSFAVNQSSLQSLSRSYDVATHQSDADDIKEVFDSLSMVGSKISKQLGDSWGYIYDNKSFAYGVLMEVLGFSDVLQKEAELMREAQAEFSSRQTNSSGDELLRYLVQKSSMVEYETLVAQKMGLSSAVDSLQVVANKLSVMDKNIENPTIKERLFINYEPIEYVETMPYTTSNPIPETEIYEKGVIFRIYVGSFQVKQAASIFRKTTPVSYLVNDKNRYCYYVGGFATLEEAEVAFDELKDRGFRVPQIVVWSDGKERNLTTDPLEEDLSYRLEILDATALSDEVRETVAEVVPNNPISKVGTDKFVILSLESKELADSLAEELTKVDANLNIVVSRSEVKIEF
ncbi:MAG: SPOR domain-containing protein [Rikenellaceae bacterium]